jgi:putative endonuclease
LSLLTALYRLADNVRDRKLRDVGKRGEDLAHRYLRAHGFIVVARNWRPPQGGGEIDIVAWEDSWLVFVEVKARASSKISVPERGIDPDKIDALRRAARDYIRRSAADESHVRFDAISVTGGVVEHFREAFAPV